MSSDGKQASVRMDGVPFLMVGWRSEEITTIVDVSAYTEVKLRGLLCHATQFDTNNPPERAQQMSKPAVYARDVRSGTLDGGPSTRNGEGSVREDSGLHPYLSPGVPGRG